MIQTVAVAGINGILRSAVIKNLLDAGFTVTALTTNVEKTTQAWGSKVKVALADYSSTSELAKVLVGHDSVVSLLPRMKQESHICLADAAIEAGVPHIIPSCFGIDTTLKEVRENPALAEKIAVEEHFVARAREGKITYTGIQTGWLLDWALRIGLMVNPKGATPIYDGGDIKFSSSSLDDIGRAVANALKRSDELKNRLLLMHSTVITQNQILTWAKECRPDLGWPRLEVDPAKVYEAAKTAWDAGSRDPALMRGFMPHNTFGLRQGLFEPSDNEMLGIEVWNEQKTKDFVMGIVRDL